MINHQSACPLLLPASGTSLVKSCSPPGPYNHWLDTVGRQFSVIKGSISLQLTSQTETYSSMVGMNSSWLVSMSGPGGGVQELGAMQPWAPASKPNEPAWRSDVPPSLLAKVRSACMSCSSHCIYVLQLTLYVLQHHL